MKYFTRDLLDRFGSEDDDIADAANEESELLGIWYRKHWKQITPRLPRKFRRMCNSYYLHDARVRFFGNGGDELHITLDTVPPPKPTLFLRYKLVEPYTLTQVVQAKPDAPHLYWLYDEVDIIGEGDAAVVEQRIMFTRVVDLTVRFRKFAYSVASPIVLPTPVAV